MDIHFIVAIMVRQVPLHGVIVIKVSLFNYIKQYCPIMQTFPNEALFVWRQITPDSRFHDVNLSIQSYYCDMQVLRTIMSEDIHLIRALKLNEFISLRNPTICPSGMQTSHRHVDDRNKLFYFLTRMLLKYKRIKADCVGHYSLIDC